jgi:copper chaperone CopZ
VKSSPPEANPTAAATTVEPGTALIEVRGMSCPLCANNINNELSDLPGVRKVDVDLGTGLVTVRLAPDSPLTAEQLTNAVRESGFTPGEVRLNQSKPNTEGGQ